MSVFDPYLYIFGGNSDLGPLNDLWVYQVPYYKWIKLSSTNSPPPRCRHASTSYTDGVNEYFVIFGGSLINGLDNALYM